MPTKTGCPWNGDGVHHFQAIDPEIIYCTQCAEAMRLQKELASAEAKAVS